MAFVEIKDLTFKYNGATSNALENISLEIAEGDFVLLIGKSGSGKSTLLRMLKPQLSPEGQMSGEIYFDGEPLADKSERKTVSEIGMVMQSPDAQIVSDKVSHELAFGLESLGESSDSIAAKLSEVCSYFGISHLFNKKTYELSGGEKQLISLASVMALNPKLLILDEPTAELDPIASTKLLGMLKKLNDETGVTIILAEHRLEEAFCYCDKVAVMEQGKILCCAKPSEIIDLYSDKQQKNDVYASLPTPVKLFNETGKLGTCPLSVKDARKYIAENFNKDLQTDYISNESEYSSEVALEISDGYFRYEKSTPDVLNDLSLKVYQNEILCILGANGAGKTTLLKILGGVKRLYKGKYRLFGKKIKEFGGNSLYRGNISVLCQNPQNLFVKNKVWDELYEMTVFTEIAKELREGRIEEIAMELGIRELFDKHPYDLSGGEAQKVAMAKILLLDPKIILLDEPTKGLDAQYKIQFSNLLKKLKGQGKTIVMVTHDIELASRAADRLAMFFDGKIVKIDTAEKFLASSTYFTTAAARITRGFFSGAVTLEKAAKACNQNKKNNE